MPRMSNVEPLALQAAKDGKGDEAGEKNMAEMSWFNSQKAVDLHGVYTYVIYIVFWCL